MIFDHIARYLVNTRSQYKTKLFPIADYTLHSNYGAESNYHSDSFT